MRETLLHFDSLHPAFYCSPDRFILYTRLVVCLIYTHMLIENSAIVTNQNAIVYTLRNFPLYIFRVYTYFVNYCWKNKQKKIIQNIN
jgi:hypothetical protein